MEKAKARQMNQGGENVQAEAQGIAGEANPVRIGATAPGGAGPLPAPLGRGGPGGMPVFEGGAPGRAGASAPAGGGAAPFLAAAEGGGGPAKKPGGGGAPPKRDMYAY